MNVRVTAGTSIPVLAVALGLAGCAQPPAAVQPPPTVDVVAAGRATVRPTLTLPGIIAPLQEVQLSTTLAEPADTVTVREGDRVRAGQVLAVLDTADLRASLASAVETAVSDAAKTTQTRYAARLAIVQGDQSVVSARAALAQAQQTLTNDRVNLVRDQQLVANGYLAQQTVDQQSTLVRNDEQAVSAAQATLTNAIEQQLVNGNGTAPGLQAATIAAAQADEAAAYAAADQIRSQIVKARIISPVDGNVVNRNLNPGEYPGSRQIFTIQETGRVYAILNATSHDVFAAPANASATVRVQGQERAFTGRIAAILDALTPGTTNFAVKVELANPDRSLHAGMPVTASFALAPSAGIAVPTTAFADDTHGSVFAVGPDGIVQPAAVRELHSDGVRSIVSGLRAGTLIVRNGQAGLVAGERVTIVRRVAGGT